LDGNECGQRAARVCARLESGHWSMTELCERYGVSRPTGYKWLERHQAAGGAGLTDRSRTPRDCPHRTGDAQEAAIIAVRLEFARRQLHLPVSDN